MTKEQIRRWHHVIEVVTKVAFPGYEFYIRDTGDAGFVLIYVAYDEKDVVTGEMKKQYGRRWIIEDDATDMAIIQTCFKALTTSLEHRAREHFTFRGYALLQPHHKLSDLMGIAPARTTEADPIELEDKPEPVEIPRL